MEGMRMMGNNFRRIALAQGLLPATPATTPLPAPDPSVTPDTTPTCPLDKPAMADRHTDNA